MQQDPKAMSQDEMAELQQMAGKGNTTPVTKLAQDVAQGLSKLADLLANSPGATEKDNAQMQQILSLFVDLVEKKLAGAEPGQDAEEEGEQLSEMPMEQGMSGVPMGPQSKN